MIKVALGPDYSVLAAQGRKRGYYRRWSLGRTMKHRSKVLRQARSVQGQEARIRVLKRAASKGTRTARDAALRPELVRTRLRIAKIRHPFAREIDRMIKEAFASVGLKPPGRGRKLPIGLKHPFPRKNPGYWERKYSLEALHKEKKHQRIYVVGCERCYIREYTYFQRHPELKPKQEGS